MFFCDMVLQMKIIETWIWSILTHLTTRCGMCAKYKQPYVAQSEVNYSLLPQLGQPPHHWDMYNRQHHHRRVAGLMSRNCVASLQSRSCKRGSVTHGYVLYRYLYLYSLYNL